MVEEERLEEIYCQRIFTGEICGAWNREKYSAETVEGKEQAT